MAATESMTSALSAYTPHPGRLLRVHLMALVIVLIAASSVAGDVRPRALLVSTKTVIYKIPLDTRTKPTTYGQPLQIVSGTFIRGMAVDEVRGFMYWGDNHTINRAALSGRNIKVIIVKTGELISAIVVDSVQNKLYYSDSNERLVVVANTDGSGSKVLITATDITVGLAIDWNTRLLIYSGGGTFKMNLTTKTNTLVSWAAFTSYIAVDPDNSRMCWNNYRNKRIQCSSYSGNEHKTYDTTGSPKDVTIENDVIYYTQDDPNRLVSTDLVTRKRLVFALNTDNAWPYHGITTLHWDDDELALDPPVDQEKAVQLIDADNDTCLALAQLDSYTFSDDARRWVPSLQDKCLQPGLTISRRVSDAMKTSFIVIITGRRLVCSNSHFKVVIRHTKWSLCETDGIYRMCALSGSTAPGDDALTSCVARCTCDGGDCKHVTIHIPEVQENWEVCDIRYLSE